MTKRSNLKDEPPKIDLSFEDALKALVSEAPAEVQRRQAPQEEQVSQTQPWWLRGYGVVAWVSLVALAAFAALAMFYERHVISGAIAVGLTWTIGRGLSARRARRRRFHLLRESRERR